MQIAILSDIHDNLWNLAAALQFLEGRAALMLCCGDLCSPFVIDQLARFRGEVNVVFGNNDADLFRISTNASRHGNIRLHGEFFEGVFDKRHIAMNHFDYLARPIAGSARYDLVCFGHNHEWEIGRSGHTQLINPGAIMGAKFSGGRWQDVTPTFVIYDTASSRPESYAIDLQTKSIGSHVP